MKALTPTDRHLYSIHSASCRNFGIIRNPLPALILFFFSLAPSLLHPVWQLFTLRSRNLDPSTTSALQRKRPGHAGLLVVRTVGLQNRLAEADCGSAVADAPPPWRNLELLEDLGYILHQRHLLSHRVNR